MMPLVEVTAAEAGVAVGGQHLKHAVANLQQAHIERAAAEVINQNLVGIVLVKAVGQRSGGRLVDDTQDFQAAMRPRPWSPDAGCRRSTLAR